MARALSKTLIRETHSLSHDFPSSTHLMRGIRLGGNPRPASWRLTGFRLRSSRPEAGQLFEVDLGQGADAANVEVEVLSLPSKLENAIQVLVVRKSAPGWLPFAPGSSYWIPPSPRSHGSILGIFGRPEKSLTVEEEFCRTTQCGCPSLPYFVDGAIPDHDSAKILTKAGPGLAAESDEEE